MQLSLKPPFLERRNELIEKLVTKHGDGVILLIGDLENHHHNFLQESSYYYFTGVDEPATFMTIHKSESRLWVPTFKTSRRQWVESEIVPDENQAQNFEVNQICQLGEPLAGYSVTINSPVAGYQFLIDYLKNYSEKNIFIPLELLNPTQRIILSKIQSAGIKLNLVDCSALVKLMRMSKSPDEIDRLYRAIEITQHAHAAAAKCIKPGTYEKEVQAAIEYVFTASGATPAFPTIVGTGHNGTILHYTSGKSELVKGDLVVVDCGAKYNNYCADITRTYPVSGKFTKRQQELYDIVLETQSLIAENAKPGAWINNAHEPEKSLQHIALNFLKTKNLDQYFVHGIGHHLGLDVHDVNEKRPLQPNDIITIEPGIYIPQENLGVRIEDNYWIMPDGSICLSESIVKERDILIDAINDKN
jgi:Xaa-Pro aminopeptidase